MRRLLFLLPFLLTACGNSLSAAGDLITSAGTTSPQVTSPDIFSYSVPVVTTRSALAMQSVTPTLAESGVTYSISPALPAGFTLDPSSGQISGSASTLLPPTGYTITAHRPGKADAFGIFNLAIVAGTASLAQQGMVRTVSGFTDTAIQAAIDSAASGDTIYFPKGVYEISATLSLRQSLLYQGEVGAILHNAHGITLANVSNSQAYHIQIDGLIFDGGNLIITGDPVTFGTDIVVINCTFRNINTATSFGQMQGILIDHIQNSRFDYNHFSNNSGNSVAYSLISYTSNHTSYSHNTFYNTYQGMHFESADSTGGTGLTISYNTAYGLLAIGIEINQHSNSSLIDHNHMDHWRSGDLNGMAYSIVPNGSGNTVQNNYADGTGCSTCNIGIESAGSNGLVQNNEIHGFLTTIAISCAPGTVFKNNTLVQTGGWGVISREGGYCSGYSILTNLINGISVTGYTL